MIIRWLYARRKPLSLLAHFCLTALFALVIVLLYFGFAYLNNGVVSYAH